MATKLITFDDIIHIPKMFQKSIGAELYESSPPPLWRKILYKFTIIAGFVNFNLVIAGELVTVRNAFQSRDTVWRAIAVGPCLGYSLASDFKQVVMTVHRKRLRDHFDVMKDLFPKTLDEQLEYRTQEHYRIMMRIMYILSCFCEAYTSTFCLVPVFQDLINVYILGAPEFERGLGYLIWYPFDTKDNTLVYWTVYFSQVWACHVAGMAFISADLLLVGSVTQLAMHFEYLVRRFEAFKWNDQNEEANMEYLYTLVRHHARCLDECENMNSVFGSSLLLTFFIASMSICCIGVEVTSSTALDIFKYSVFLIAELVQVFIVCYYGDKLMTSSMSVADAAYNQMWLPANLRYKKMLVQVIQRSQKPASIRPPTLPPLSFNTFMKVISMSYQFFALLRTTYSDA